jgi:DNA replication protein DnaC
MHNYDNYNKVKEIIEDRRNRARAISLERAEEVASRSEEIREIDRELRGVVMQIFNTACSGGDLEPIKKRNLELNDKRRECLSKMGLPRDYTDVKYTCPICMDTGFVDMHMCTCFKELLVTENIKSSGMGHLIEEENFENFDLSHYRSSEEDMARMKDNLQVAKAFAENFGSGVGGKNMLFVGKTGTGKTHISTSVAKEIIKRGYNVVYESAQNIVNDFESDKFRSGYGYSEPRGDKYLTCDLLIMDDLGAEFINQFTVACLYNILTTRRNRGLSTIISTNLTAEELSSRYDDRICSRLMGSDYRIMFFTGRDYRLFGK